MRCMMTSSVFGAVLCVVLVSCEAKEISNSGNSPAVGNPKLRTWSSFAHKSDINDGTEVQSLEGGASFETETFKPLVLNPNSTYEQYQSKPNNRFLDWLLSFWNGGNNNHGSNNHNNNNNNKPTTPHKCSSCKCGLTNTWQRIVGGVITKVNHWPWVVALMNNNQFYCGGSLINSKYVLTAAHCTKGVAKERVLAVFSEHDRSDPSETMTFVRKISGIFRHAKYNMNANYNNDISLLQLAQEVSFSDKLRPVCLPALEQSYAGYVGTVTGWGATAEYGSTSKVLREVNVPIISNDDCRKTKYGNKITTNMLCAGFIGKGGKDACQGDSGGPLHVANGTKNMIVGIVSWGEGCAEAEYPGVYTRVNRFITWIHANTVDACYCTE